MSSINLHAQILKKNGKEEFVILPYDEFLALKDILEDAEDLLALEDAKREAGDEKPLPFEIIEQEFEADITALRAGDEEAE